jgi:hypothetical protein
MADAFDGSVAVPDDWTPFFNQMTDQWPRISPDTEVAPATVVGYLSGAHKRELEQAAKQPVINVTVAGLPGHYAADTATGELSYSPVPAPEPDGPLAVTEPCT